MTPDNPALTLLETGYRQPVEEEEEKEEEENEAHTHACTRTQACTHTHTQTHRHTHQVERASCQEALMSTVELLLTSKIPTVDSILQPRTMLVTMVTNKKQKSKI